MIFIAAHLSRAETLTEWLEPSVSDELNPNHGDGCRTAGADAGTTEEAPARDCPNLVLPEHPGTESSQTLCRRKTDSPKPAITIA
jgi:hypothetical protein